MSIVCSLCKGVHKVHIVLIFTKLNSVVLFLENYECPFVPLSDLLKITA